MQMKITYENGKEKKNEKSAKIMKKLKIWKSNNKMKETINENNYQDKNGNFNLIKNINYI